MLSSDIKPLKAGLQEKNTIQFNPVCDLASLWGCFPVARRVERNTDRESLAGWLKSKWLCEEDPLPVIQSTLDLQSVYASTQIHSGIHTDANLYMC